MKTAKNFLISKPETTHKSESGSLYDFNLVENYLDEYADQFKPKWVSVDDGLPTQEGDYLVFDPDFEAQMVASFSNGKFELDVSYWEPKDITHWMPLPTPPEQ